jgi:hypothetical protein
VSHPEQDHRPGGRHLSLRFEHLWPALALSTIITFISLKPTLPNDFWWHLKAGALIAESGIPTTNIFAWTLPAEHPYIYQSWLSEWLYYQLYRLGGWYLVVFTRNLLGGLTFVLLAFEAQRRSRSWQLAALVTFLAAAMASNNFAPRTQNWSWLPFLLTLIIMARYTGNRLHPRWLIALPLIMLAWVNLHGAFIMGLLVAGAFVVGETIRKLLRRPEAPDWFRLIPLYAALAAMFSATLANPLGFGVYEYVFMLLGDSPSQTLINEWRTPDPRTIAGAFFFIGLLAVVASFGLSRYRPSISEIILICGLAWQSFVGVRYVVWFGLATMPILAQSLSGLGSGTATDEQAAAPQPAGAGYANLAIVLLLFSFPVLVQPWLKPALPLPQPYQDLFVDMPEAQQIFSADTPYAAVEHLREQPCHGRIFNEMGYGSYMAWALYPTNQSFIDPRVELFPIELWNDYVLLTEGRRVAELFEHYDISCALIDPARQYWLAETLPELPGWHLSFQDQRSEVWRRQPTTD